MYAELATIESEIEDVSIIRGESAEFTFKFSKRDVDIDIKWSVDDIVFDECGSTEKDIAPDGNGCYTTDTESVLLLQNTSMFTFRSYSVQCFLQQNITDDFREDPTFQNHFNTLTSNSYLFGENYPKHVHVTSPYIFYFMGLRHVIIVACHHPVLCHHASACFHAF